jgi:hypothetical protein
VTDMSVVRCGGATSREPVAVCGSEASPMVRGAIASPKREYSDYAHLCRIIVFLSLWRALGGCGALLCLCG